MKVIVVESPSKARKIQSYFPDYKIVSSCGHIYDLSKKTLSIDVDDNFSPRYQPIDGKQKIIKNLKSYSKQDILLAADDDREGDAIAWHCAKVMNVDLTKNNRIKFHEISKTAIEKSINNPTALDMNSVNAQQARRIIDRLIGFSISPLLWKHIDTNVKGLSAGRVQSPLLYLLDKHEQDILKHEVTNDMIINSTFDDIYETKYFSKEKFSFQDIFDIIKLSRKFNLLSQIHTKIKRYPKPPFITSSLQRTALKELGFNVKTTNSIAQKLYENGKITYIRTDSPNVSLEFQQCLSEFISDRYDDLFIRHESKQKVKGAQEAHECIRVTNLQDTLNGENFNDYDKKLYKLIYKNTVTSHMKPAIYDRITYKFTNEHFKDIGYFQGSKDVLIYDGYLRYNNPKLDLSESNKDLDNKDYYMTSCVSHNIPTVPKSHVDESSIIKLLETSGIGRPSTYASIIATINNKNYTITKNIDSYKISYDKNILNDDNTISNEISHKIIPPQKNKIILTDLGKSVLRYLNTHFSHIINPIFTSLVETDLDSISMGKIEWRNVIKRVYDSFIDIVMIQNKTIKNNYYKRHIGKHNRKQVLLLQGKYGYFVKYGTKNINIDRLLSSNNPDDITMDDIKHMLL
jgi:DNA topoisomerase-1